MTVTGDDLTIPYINDFALRKEHANYLPVSEEVLQNCSFDYGEHSDNRRSYHNSS